MIKHLDKEKLNTYIEKGLIRQRWNNEHTLFTINYTEACTHENAWDEYTLGARGHIYDANYDIVMPMMDKFFNLFQLQTDKQKDIIRWMTNETPFEVTQKYDGCLGAIFPYKGELIFTSKSTFDNYVVEACKRIVKDKVYINDLEDTSTGLVVEIICPETRQVVNYGDLEEVRVITSYNLCETDSDYLQERPYEITKKIVETMNTGLKMVNKVEINYEQLQDWVKTHDWTEEGWVVKFEDNERVKFKSEDYLHVAAIKSYLDLPHLINVAITDGTPDWLEKLHNMVLNLPDELQNLADRMIAILEVKWEFNFDKIFMLMQSVKDLSDKELGMKNDNKELNKYKSLVFSLRKGKDITRPVLEMVKEEIRAYEKINGPITSEQIPEWRQVNGKST